MGDVGDFWWDVNEARKERKAQRLAAADPTGWTQHTPYHWSQTLNGKRLDYWPSTGKFMYDGKVYYHGIKQFLLNNQGNTQELSHARERSSTREEEVSRESQEDTEGDSKPPWED